MKKLLFLLAICLSFSASTSFAQPRPIEKSEIKNANKTVAPASFEARYEGGIFGFNDKETGTMKFDDANARMVFYGKDQKEKFAIPYAAMLVVYPQSQSVTSTTGNIIKYIPLPGAGLAGFIKEKRRYLVVNYDDPDVDVKGTASFKLDNKEMLDTVLDALGEKAKLAPRGDAYYRPKEIKSGDSN